MKKTKLIAAILAAVLLLVPLAPSAFAMDALLDTIIELLGGDTPGESYALSDLFTNPNGVLDEIRNRLGTELDNSALIEAITKVLGGDNGQTFSLESLLDNGFLNRLREILNMEQVTDAPTDAPTVPPATYVTQTPSTATALYTVTAVTPATLPTTTKPTTTAPATTAPSTTAAPITDMSTVAEPSYTFAQPATVTVPELTSQPEFTPSVTDEGTVPQKGSTLKTVVGVLVMLLMLGAVVAVAVILRRTAI